MTDTIDYVERWEHALLVLENMSEHERIHHFNMKSWGQKTECGTVACLAGHCAFNSWFQERGFTAIFRSNGGTELLVFDNQSAADFFGTTGHDKIFCAVLDGFADVITKVKYHIAYLRCGGNPNDEEADYCHDEEDDYEY
jgi:hypothetical protein